MFPYLARFAGFFSSFQQITSSVGGSEEGVYVPITWYEKAIDALHRMIRPTTVYSLMILCMFGWYDPDRLMKFAKGLHALPELYWYGYLIVLLTIAAPKMINSIRTNGSAPSDMKPLGANSVPLGVPTGTVTNVKTEVTTVTTDKAGPSRMPPPPGSE